MIYNCKRTASVRSKNYCTLAMLEKKSFQEITDNYPDLVDRMKHHVKTNYSIPNKDFFVRSLQKVNYLSELSDELEEMYFFSELEHMEHNKYIFKKGEKSEHLYVIRDGTVHIEL